ncbi:MAG: CRISPR-associated endonuclease Cas1 [Chloroflexi bacterium]|nr:CRISPR-associated endonuclease Cas1 [Chloroflexota bacterium]
MPNLYVTEQGARLEREYDRLLVVKDAAVLLDVPAIKVNEVVLVGRIGVTTPALQMLLERDIGVVLVSRLGEFLGRLSGDRASNTALRRAQYRRADEPEFCLGVARAVAWGKVWNCRVRCLRIAAAADNGTARQAGAKLGALLPRFASTATVAEVRFLEAQAGRAYFAAMRSQLHPGWEFPSRQRRPPPDPINVLLSATYTLLTEAVYSATIIAGLDPYCGFYHVERPGRPALVLDLMEEFRPLIADSVVVTLVNKRLLTPRDFRPGPPVGADGRPPLPVILHPDGYKTVLRTFGERLRTPVTIPRLGRRTTYHRLLEVQARALAAAIEGRRPAYEPFRTR